MFFASTRFCLSHLPPNGSPLTRRITLAASFASVIAMAALAPPASAASTSDVSPPKLRSLSYSPASVDITSGPAQVVVTAQFRDAVEVAGGYIYFRTQVNDQIRDTAAAQFTRVRGDAQQGRWEATITIPQGSPPGQWEYIGAIRDSSGNSTVFGNQFYSHNLPIGAPGPLTVEEPPAHA
jgi:hypothetical protein